MLQKGAKRTDEAMSFHTEYYKTCDAFACTATVVNDSTLGLKFDL